MAIAVLAGAPGGAAGSEATAAALAAAAARDGRAVVLVELGSERRFRPTLLATRVARDLERRLARVLPELRPAARGTACFLAIPSGERELEQASALLEALPGEAVCVMHLPPRLWQLVLAESELAPSAALVRADLPAERPLVALAVRDLRERGLTVRVAKQPLGRLSAHRARAGLEAAGAARRLAKRQARVLFGERGQALPAVLAAVALVLVAALALGAVAGALTGKGRVQRAADLAAISAARSLRDDLPAALAPARLEGGGPNPIHMSLRRYLRRARATARGAAVRNGVDPDRVRISFPPGTSTPLRVRVRILAELSGASSARSRVEAVAVAEAAPDVTAGSMPAYASGGGYAGPLVYRQGEPMRPDIAVAFDRMAAAAESDGIALLINSAFRSDAEQAVLFAQHPDPRWVAPPGHSLHRCATELDLGPSSAYAWLAGNAGRFGFVQRYSWEPWHYGYDAGPAPCSAAAERLTAASGDGGASGTAGLPGFVPSAYRNAILAAAARHGVSAALLAAQLMAESGFDPSAVSSAGALGIAQFIPSTAAAYGLHDPFDPWAAIDAQARLMADLLRQFSSVALALAAYNAGPGAVAACACVPPYLETQAYVARILALMQGAGALALAPPLEVRLVA